MAEAVTNPQRASRIVRGFAVAAALLVSACSTVVPRGPAPPPPTKKAPPPAPRPDAVEAGIPRDTARNRVALLVPLSGTNAGVGKSLANATQLALLDTGSQQVRVTNYDTATGAAVAAQRAISDGATPAAAQAASIVGAITFPIPASRTKRSSYA